jgi:hypothetical protein
MDIGHWTSVTTLGKNLFHTWSRQTHSHHHDSDIIRFKSDRTLDFASEQASAHKEEQSVIDETQQNVHLNSEHFPVSTHLDQHPVPPARSQRWVRCPPSQSTHPKALRMNKTLKLLLWVDHSEKGAPATSSPFAAPVPKQGTLAGSLFHKRDTPPVFIQFQAYSCSQTRTVVKAVVYPHIFNRRIMFCRAGRRRRHRL